MTRYRLVLISAVVALALVVGAWAFSVFHAVDGRTAAEWLAFARQAALTVTYHATGMTETMGGTSAHFTLVQGANGEYTMRTLDESGRQCLLGFDGKEAWYRSGKQSARVASEGTAMIPLHARARLLGEGEVARRLAIWVQATSGSVVKRLAVDRKTGVILAMVTLSNGKEVSRMRVEEIDYREVTVERCVMEDQSALRAADPATVARILGGSALKPAWLPAGFIQQGTLTDWCDCCGGEVVVLRYSDGLRGLTLFEMTGMRDCAMDAGCRMAPHGNALIDTRQIDDITVVGVGDVEKKTLARVLDSLRRTRESGRP